MPPRLLPFVKIEIRTNIPGDLQPVTLTSDLFIVPSTSDKTLSTTKYPFFRTDVEFTKGMLDDCTAYSFFFDDRTFRLATAAAPRVTNEEKTAKANMMFLLKYLLVTSFPTKDNLDDSYQANILQTRTSVARTEIFPNFFATAKKSAFACLTMRGKQHTVVGVTWINDFLNHSRFNQLMRDILRYVEDKKDTVKKLQDELATLVTMRVTKDVLQTVFDAIRLAVTMYSHQPTDPAGSEDIRKWFEKHKKFINDPKVEAIFSEKKEFETMSTVIAPMLYEFHILQVKNSKIRSTYGKPEASLAFRRFAYDTNLVEFLETVKEFYIKFRLGQFHEGKYLVDGLMLPYTAKIVNPELTSFQEYLTQNSSFRTIMSRLCEFVPYNTLQVVEYKYRGAQKNPILTNIRSPNLCYITSNANLQEELITYIKSGARTGSGVENLVVAMDDFYNHLSTTTTSEEDPLKDKSLLRLDVIKVTDSRGNVQHFEVEVQLELLAGILNEDIISKIQCSFEDQRLQSQYERLKKKVDDSPFYQTRPYFDVAMFIKAPDEKKKKGGGSRRRQRRRMQSRRRKL